MKISVAEFWASASHPREIPRARGSEVAIAGRSNVGKSSLINRLTGRRALARTSSTPGCTRGLTFFRIDELTLVDLPGYGWAKRSVAERRAWKRLVEHYLEKRQALAGVLILVDVRRGPEEEELQLADFLDAHEIPYAWVATKCDKLPRSKLSNRLAELTEALDGQEPLSTSARTRSGLERVWGWMRRATAEHARVGTMRG